MMENKEIILRPSNLFAFAKAIPMLLLTMIFLLLAWPLSPFFILFSAAALGIAWYRFLLVRSCWYLVEAEFIKIRSGILFRRIEQVELYRVKDYILTQPLFHQMFRIMDLELKTTDTASPVIRFRGIPVSDIVDTLRDRVQEARQRNKIFEIN
jgi:uncharacterized membrane protein YdbT with pleckstrin-like domain